MVVVGSVFVTSWPIRGWRGVPMYIYIYTIVIREIPKCISITCVEFDRWQRTITTVRTPIVCMTLFQDVTDPNDALSYRWRIGRRLWAQESLHPVTLENQKTRANSSTVLVHSESYMCREYGFSPDVTPGQGKR